MNTNLVDTLLETVFFPGEEGGLEDQPHPRFKWKPPVEAGGIPPSETPHHGSTAPPGLHDVRPEDSPPPEDEPLPNVDPGSLDDRTGSVSMSQMLPKEEVATSDDLIDFFARIRDAKGKKKKMWQKEFDAHRTEFESKLHAFVDKLLVEAVCEKCGQEVGDRYFADKNRNGKKINICGTCYMKDDEHSGGNRDHGSDRFDTPEYTGTGYFPRR